jgi:hypothetical protein
LRAFCEPQLRHPSKPSDRTTSAQQIDDHYNQGNDQ